ncbi:Dynein heavy chain family dynein heavy chain, related [Eimeria tenella]|uniref:Dynein heavy chain family dynein heavy chain, related n=1 Tax=Eimeria tenella TaxID=5802 RepID=U6KJM6_EIMTE|nr:Dynein heavy chain family dynein heavy chain, related [Eimeria tenella]CDJ38235.1 Dynein heavy chain family dynein heavy chain, related [Eimeria tenella]|eukprot:XP_013229073.1 Dynein heavy chain family dynein heavy chain, related [Eimeria tenella]
MCGLLVNARPRTKFFIYGGASSEVLENPKRFQTRLCSDIEVLTLGEECHWDVVQTVSAATAAAEQRESAEKACVAKRRPQGTAANASPQATAAADLPLPREGATMAYFAEDSTLVVFGGWSGKWLGDLWTCCVSSVVGPPYAILDVSPPHGPMTGGTPISVRGAGFTAGSICVRFSAGEFFVDVPGTFISTTEIRAVTPNVKAALGESKHHFSQLPHLSLKKQTSDKSPRTCEIRVKIGAKDLTSSLCSFQFFANSCASYCLAVGPGLLSDGAPGVPTSFFIEARNAQNGKRTTGGDNFVVRAFVLPEVSLNASPILLARNDCHHEQKQ